ncbi:PRC-barrel domain-containing protein [Microbacterium neungamense]|uniref:PRC-barrel domain-containing protein n=1 Tax=Microbacterium neungamense TaxID=2810535 RepID=UPI00217DCC2B|nr:PRC-barrel domain-containing protein [Microbacterium neungamense]UWF77301.1 PRC-barrel domain-containing protein [Microbacterium neungamense]
MDTPQHELVSLADSDRTVAEEDDIRGRTVRDPDGEEIGKVEDLLVDTEENKVRFLVVASGGFLGLGEHRSYIPVDAVTGIRDDEVRIDQSRERLAGAPGYDPELINDREYNEGVFGYYGYTPFWAAGYVYPAYPYLP